MIYWLLKNKFYLFKTSKILLWNQLWIVLLKTFKVISKTILSAQIFSKVLLISQKKSLGIHTHCFHSRQQTKPFKVNNYWTKIKSKLQISTFKIFNFRQFKKEKPSKLMKRLTTFSKLAKKKSRPFAKTKTNSKLISILSSTSLLKKKLTTCTSPNSSQTKFSKIRKWLIRKNLSSF